MITLLPASYKPIDYKNGIILAHDHRGQWVTWKVSNNELIEGHFFCHNCPDAESLARTDFEQRCH